jgi:hypothetical protein
MRASCRWPAEQVLQPGLTTTFTQTLTLTLPQDGGVYSNLGAHLRRTDRMPESRATYAAAIRADPENAEAYIGLGKCFTAPAGAFSSEAKAGTHSKRTCADLLRVRRAS